MKKIKLTLLAARVELHWWYIIEARQKGGRLVREGAPYSSERFLALNRMLSRHAAKALRAQLEYEHLGGGCASLGELRKLEKQRISC